MTRILIIEDEPALARALAITLKARGYDTTVAVTGSAGLERAADGHPDLVLLDLGLPDIDGLEVCRRLRANSTIPIIVLTARGDEIDRVLLLELGADDYLVKPFGFRELVARIGAVSRRALPQQQHVASGSRTGWPGKSIPSARHRGTDSGTRHSL